jgi:hypothetical protein
MIAEEPNNQRNMLITSDECAISTLDNPLIKKTHSPTVAKHSKLDAVVRFKPGPKPKSPIKVKMDGTEIEFIHKTRQQQRQSMHVQSSSFHGAGSVQTLAPREITRSSLAGLRTTKEPVVT